MVILVSALYFVQQKLEHAMLQECFTKLVRESVAIEGDMSQHKREESMQRFRKIKSRHTSCN